MISLRPASANDCAFAYRVACDPVVRKSAYNDELPSWRSHWVWWQRHLDRDRIWIVEANDDPVGIVRISNEGPYDELHIGLIRRGQGIGPHAISQAASHCRRTLMASIKSSNLPSQKAFAQAGFVPHRGDLWRYHRR